MSANAYKLSFPCPECDGVLTMSVKTGEGNCPLCDTAIVANLDIQKTSPQNSESIPKRGWDNRAFRRPSTADKPMWRPIHQPAE